jgi:hypothetical protein
MPLKQYTPANLIKRKGSELPRLEQHIQLELESHRRQVEDFDSRHHGGRD